MKSNKKELSILPVQCLAARNLLRWKQKDLSELTKLTSGTIGQFERGQSKPTSRTVQDLKKTFEEAGITFICEDEAVGVILNKSKNLS